MQQETEKLSRRQWLESVMDRWEASLLRLCFAYLGDRGLAEDAVQETFLKAWKGYDTLLSVSVNLITLDAS